MSGVPIEIDTEKVEQYASQGLTVKQIADCCNCGRSTFYRYMKSNGDIKDAIKRGRSKGIETVTNALFEGAKGGNVTAQIFYLKNRQPDKWSDRRNHEVTGKDGKPMKMDHDVNIYIHDAKVEEDGSSPPA